MGISIHALREEGDQFEIRGIPVNKKFQSTPSARRATQNRNCANAHRSISIHALREEGDRLNFPAFLGVEIISIHALREEGDG